MVGLWLRGVSDSNGRDPGFNSRHLKHFTFVAFSGTNSCNKHEKGAQACFTCGSDKYWYISSNLVITEMGRECEFKVSFSSIPRLFLSQLGSEAFVHASTAGAI